MAQPVLTRHVDSLFPDLEHLFQAGEDVAAVIVHPGWAAVKALVASEIDAINARLDAGHEPLEQAEYALAHGRRGGLLALQGAADAILERAERRRREQAERHEPAAELYDQQDTAEIEAVAQEG
jgi:hypothetical protein